MKNLVRKIKENKILRFIVGFVKTIITLVLILMLLVILVQRFSSNDLSIGGIRVFTIISNSMLPDYEPGDILVLKEENPSNIMIGDDVTYIGKTGQVKGLVVTHKVIDKREEEGKYYFTTQGTNNEIADPEIDESQIYGKVIYKTVLLSVLCKIMLKPAGYYVLFMLVALVISYQIVSMIFNKDEEDEMNGEKE